MSLIVAVLDANVLYPQELRDTLIRAGQKDLYHMRWTHEILEEMRRNLVKRGRSTEIKSARLVGILQNMRESLIVADYQALIPVMQNDPKDRHVLAAAVICGANVIVTENLRDFPPTALAPYEMEALSPDTFLNWLNDEDPGMMMQVIQEQAADNQYPPLSVADILQRISRQAPQFVQRVRARIAQT